MDAGNITQPVADQLVDTIADCWTVSALESLRAYNDILTFDGKAKAMERVPETMDELKRLAAGRPFANRSLKQMADTVFTGGVGGALIATIDQGMRDGWGYKKIVDRVLNESLPDGSAISRREAITLSRSYVQQASVNAQLATYWQNRAVVKGVKWTAILDNRVCMKCAALDGPNTSGKTRSLALSLIRVAVASGSRWLSPIANSALIWTIWRGPRGRMLSAKMATSMSGAARSFTRARARRILAAGGKGCPITSRSRA
ncbi:MAG: phage head morphogenesis protein [Desulfovibrio sp.]|nr:phage head morphogenesis protein [Desulfovibrio sp.]